MTEPASLSSTIASTATMKLAGIPESAFFCTPIEERFERITRLARHALRVPVAAVTFINPQRLWFKSVDGWSVTDLPLSETLCALTLSNGRLTVIPDTQADPATGNNPLVVDGPKFRAYAGYPLFNDDNISVGTICVYDRKPRNFTRSEAEALVDLAAITQREIQSDRLRNVHSELASKLGAARRESMIDPLTRLWNRRGAMVLIRSILSDAEEQNITLAVALLDLDNFKRVNDTYGHQIGDEVLRKAAGRLIRSLRAADTVCRIGGDEFLLLMTDADTRTAESITERLRTSITRSPIPTRQGKIPMSISVGYTLHRPGEEIDAEALIARADRALLEAKRQGRDRVTGTR